MVLTLTYGNGKPFANEKYALYAESADQVLQSGHTDAAGRLFFVPGSMTRGRIKAQAHHGHGIVADFSVPLLAPTPTTTATASTTAPVPTEHAVAEIPPAATLRPNPASLALFGLSLLFGGFGTYQLFLHRQTPTPPRLPPGSGNRAN